MNRIQTQLGEVIVEMQVVDVNSAYIGEVKEIREDDILVDRSLARDLYVPLDCIEKIDRKMIYLGIRKKDIEKQGWQKPALFS